MPPPSRIFHLPSQTQCASFLALPRSHLPSVASLRDVPGLEIAHHHESETLYLRAPSTDSESLQTRLHTLDANLRGRPTESGELIPEGKSVPTALLPSNLTWHPLANSTPVALPAASTGEASFESVPIRLVPSEKILPASLLLCPFLTFIQWGIAAPGVRLAPLRFAVSESSQCIILGAPLPPIPGKFFSVTENIACPLGFTWHPNIPPESLRKSAATQPSDLIFFHDPAHPPIHLPAELFLPATRQNLRATTDPRSVDLQPS